MPRLLRALRRGGELPGSEPYPLPLSPKPRRTEGASSSPSACSAALILLPVMGTIHSLDSSHVTHTCGLRNVPYSRVGRPP
ncbi:hypothetical protein SMICM304S_10373 [Streptomyces microflavus]